MEQKQIKLGEYIAVTLDEQGRVLLYSDKRPYRYGYGIQEIESSYFDFPFGRLEKDIVLKTLFGASEGQPLTPEIIKKLEERVRATDVDYAWGLPYVDLMKKLKAEGPAEKLKEFSEAYEKDLVRVREFLKKPLE